MLLSTLELHIQLHFFASAKEVMRLLPNYLFIHLFVGLLAGLCKILQADLAEIFREGQICSAQLSGD